VKRFDAATPRRMWWNSDLSIHGACPSCGKPLEREQQTFFASARSGPGRDCTDFVMSGEGEFCPSCPVVVLDPDEFGQRIGIGFGPTRNSSLQFAVIGIVDLDAIPDEKAHIQIGTDENPIPLVQFLSKKPPRVHASEKGGRPWSTGVRGKKKHNKHKHRRK